MISIAKLYYIFPVLLKKKKRNRDYNIFNNNLIENRKYIFYLFNIYSNYKIKKINWYIILKMHGNYILDYN